MTKFRAALAATVLLALAAPSARAEVEHGVEAWHLALAQGRIAGGALYWLELQPRVDLLGDPGAGRVLLRPAVGYELHKVSLWAGYAWVPTWTARRGGAVAAGENRLFQQFLYNDGFGAFRVQSRTRFEQRLVPSSPQLAHRFRTLARLGVSLTPGGPVSLVGWDEIFFHLNTVAGGPQRGFDQNRAFAGVSWRATPSFTFEAGYVNVFVNRGAQPAAMTHALYTFTVWNFL